MVVSVLDITMSAQILCGRNMKKQTKHKRPKRIAARSSKIAAAVKAALPVIPAVPALLKLNLGAGKSRIEGYLSVDTLPFEGIDVVADLREKWPWADNTVSNIHASHMIEHFTAEERFHVFNEMYRVLAPGGTVYVITPHWNSQRAYGDLSHQWPPMSEFFYHYLWKEWRLANAPHVDSQYNPIGFNCDFSFGGGYGVHEEVLKWNQERSQYAQKWFRDACADIHMTITSLKKTE